MIVSIAAVIAFLLLSAFFSGSETALTGASQAFMLDQEKNEHNPKAKTINRLFKHRDKLIITTLLGSNLFNTMATSLATSVLISLFGSEGVAYATVIMTILILIYTDMLPKSYSVKHANAVALVVAPMVNFWVAVFSPLTYVLQKIVNLTFRLFKLQSSGENSEDAAISEIRGAIDMYKGEEIKEESEMLKSILDLDDVEVYDVMNHRRNLFALNIDMPVKKMVDKVKNSPFSRIPLYQDKPENIVGVIRVKHLLKECVDKKNDFSKIDVRKLMSAPWFIPENTTLLQQLQMFRKRREHFAIVVDEYGTLQGVVTLEDILEEIVGDINDETDIQNLDTMGIRKNGENSWLVDGQVPIRDINRKFGWNIDDECAVTVAGYLLEMTQSIPEPGQKFVFGGLLFEIVKRNKNQLSLIKITPQTDESAAAEKKSD